MRTLKLDEIEELSHGESIPRFTGKIRKVWDQQSGEGQYGDWYLQNIVVAMDGGEIKVTWTGEDEFAAEEWEGKRAAFECGTNKEGKLVGIVRDIRTGKNGKVYKGVKVTPAGRILPMAEDGLPPEKEPTKDAPKAAATASESPPEGWNDPKLELYGTMAKSVFFVAWQKAEDSLSWCVGKEDLAKMSVAERYDLQLRIAQGFSIEINKMLRKERF